MKIDFHKKLNRPKFFEITLIVTTVLAGFILYWQEKVNHNLDSQKSWLNFYFVDPIEPQKGVEFNNHLGYETEFRLCLIPDSDDLMEPKDISCNLETVLSAERKKVAPTEKFSWQWPNQDRAGKYWVLLQYVTKDGQENKRSLSFVK